MSDPLALAFAFAAGWLACCIVQIAVLKYQEWRDGPEPLHEFESHVCPWPTDFKRPHSTLVSGGAQPDHDA